MYRSNLNDRDHQLFQEQFSLEVTFVLLSFQGFIHSIQSYVILKSVAGFTVCLQYYREHGETPSGCKSVLFPSKLPHTLIQEC